MGKELCKIQELLIRKNPDEYAELVNKPKYLCKRCGRVANKKKSLCKPVRLKQPK